MTQTEYGDEEVSPELLIRHDDVALVYLTDDSKHNVRYELNEGTNLSVECQAFLSRARISEAISTSFLSSEKRLQWKLILGESMSLAIGGDLDTANEFWTKAHRFLGNRAEESARMWYVQACVGTILLLLLMYGVFDFSLQYIESPGQQASQTEVSHKYKMGEDDVYTVKYIMLALIAGAVGAGFSVLVRIGSLTIDPAAGWKSHYGEVLFRMTIGALAGAIIIIGWQAEVFATFMKAETDTIGDAITRASQNSFRSDFWKMIILALVAGASERMVPSLLQQLSNKTVEEPAAPAENAETQ